MPLGIMSLILVETTSTLLEEKKQKKLGLEIKDLGVIRLKIGNISGQC